MKLYIYLLFSALSIVSCYTDHSRNVKEAAKLADTNPDSAWILLRECLFPTELPQAERAEYAYLWAKVSWEIGKITLNDTLLLDAISYYKEQKDTARWIACEYYTAIAHEWRDNYQQSLAHFYEAEKIASLSNDSMLQHIYDHIGRFALDKWDYNLSREYYRKLLSYPKYKDEAYYMLSCTFAYENNNAENDSSIYYGNKCLEEARRVESPRLFHYLRNTISGMTDSEILERYKELLEMSPNKECSNLFSSIAYYYLQKRMLDSAAYYTKLAGNAYKKEWSNQGREYVSMRNSIALLNACLNYARGKEKILSGEWLGKFNDSIYFANRNVQMVLQEQMEGLILNNKRELYLQTRRQQMQTVLFVIIFLGVTATTATIVYFRKRRNQLIAAEEKIEALQLLIKDAQKANNENIPDDNFFKKILLQQLGIIKLIATEPTNKNKELLQQMTKIGQEEIKTDTLLIWRDLYPIIDSAYNGFYSKLTDRYQTLLNEKEIQLCCLLCAGFSTKEISVVSQQSERTIYQRKTSIRQKLSMEEKEDIVAFIQNI